MSIFEKLQAVALPFCSGVAKWKKYRRSSMTIFKAVWKWKQALQLLPVSRFSIGLFVIVSHPKRYNFYRRGVIAVLAMALCLSVSVTSQRYSEKAGGMKTVSVNTHPSTYLTLCYKKIVASPK